MQTYMASECEHFTIATIFLLSRIFDDVSSRGLGLEYPVSHIVFLLWWLAKAAYKTLANGVFLLISLGFYLNGIFRGDLIQVEN